MGKPQLFVSHVSEEARLAEILKEHISLDFLGMLDVFEDRFQLLHGLTFSLLAISSQWG